MKASGFLIIFFSVTLLFQPLSAQTWTAEKRLTWNVSNSSHPSVTTDSSDHIHVVWQDDISGNSEVYYKKSTDGGNTWSTKRLTSNSGDSAYPIIAADASDNLHVVWEDDTPFILEVFYKKSTDGGNTWTTKRLSWNIGESRNPAIALDSSNNIHITWTDNSPGQYEIFYKKSTDGGSTWINKRLSWNPGTSGYPSIDAISSNQVHIVWFDESPGNWEIFHKMSQDGGVSWLTRRLTWNARESSQAAIAMKSTDVIHVVWQNQIPGNWELYHKGSMNGGSSWTTQRLTWNSGDSRRPKIAMGPLGNVHIVWDDDTTGSREIYYKRSTDQGTHWNTKRLTDISDTSWFPDVAVDSSGAIHVVWDDFRHVANSEIYYIKGIQ